MGLTVNFSLSLSSHLPLSLLHSISIIDYSFSAGSVYQSPRSYSSIFPLVYRLLWASLLPSVGPNPKSHITLSTTVRRPGHIILVLQALLHIFATYSWSTYRIYPFRGEIDLIQPRVAPSERDGTRRPPASASISLLVSSCLFMGRRN